MMPAEFTIKHPNDDHAKTITAGEGARPCHDMNRMA